MAGLVIYIPLTSQSGHSVALKSPQVKSHYLLTFLEIIYYKNTQRPVFHVSACCSVVMSCYNLACQLSIQLGLGVV